MRNSNSKERQTYSQTQQQRNAKTSQSGRVAITPQNLNLNPPLTVKVENNQKAILPPKPPQKVQYKVDINMTQSKIFQAKQGLQLLKKKMNRTGASREKVYSQTQKNTQRGSQKATQISSQNARVTSKQAESKPNFDMRTTKRNNQIEQNRQPITRENQNQTRKMVAKQDINDDRPISHQVDFMQLLERQMQKQTPYQPASKQNRQQKVMDQDGQQVILQMCRMGCGRNFHPNAIEKHQKICHKVFQSKRKAFNSAAFRQPEVQGIKTIPQKTNLQPQEKAKPKNGIPKWKLQSAQLRAGLKLNKNVPLSKEEEKILATQQNNFTQCPCCGRKFNQAAASKHIPFCQKKSKQMPKKMLGTRR